MALTNYLTPGEWATAYVFGLRAVQQDEDGSDLSKLLRLGIREMSRQNYVFRGIDADAEGGLKKLRQQLDCPAQIILSMLAGGFSPREQARVSLEWAPEHAPMLELDWLREAVARADREAEFLGTREEGA
jgi:hypothetical protein